MLGNGTMMSISNNKILILANSDIGLYKFRLELIERLLKEDYKVYIVLPNGDFIKNLTNLGCNYIDIEFARRGKNIFKELALFTSYLNIIKRIKPKVVLTYTIKPNIYGAIACRLLNIPVIANVTGLGTAIENGGLLKQLLTLLYKIAFANIQRVFVQNEENKKYFVDNNIAVDKLKLIPGSGVNLERFSPNEYPSENKPIEFAFISRIMKEKGIDQYLEAAKAIKTKYPDVVFHVCGFCEAEYEDYLKDYSEKGIVKYHGMVNDIKTILKDVSCVVHPTYYPEGISNVLLEASACARPIITTNRAGCREVIDDGVNGYIVEQKNSKDLVDKLEKFILLPYQEKVKMGLAGRAKVEKEFDRHIVVKAYLDEIKDIK